MWVEEDDMGLFDRIKRAFAGAGVDVEVDAPDTFRWQDETLPVVVTLTVDDGDDVPAEITVTSLTVALTRYIPPTERTNTQPRASRPRQQLSVVRNEPVVVTIGRPVVVEVVLPLTLDAAVEGGPAWLGALSDAVSTLRDVTRDDDHEHYELRATAAVAPEGRQAVGTRRIRNLRLGETGGTGWSIGIS